MRIMAMIVAMLAGMLLIPSANAQANAQLDRTWWIVGEFGEGQFQLSSDQAQSKRDPALALGFAGGRRLTSRVRAGIHVNSWLLETFNPNDPTVGQTMTNLTGVVDAFPFRNRERLFLRGGFGVAMYTVNRETESNGRGPAWEAGAGYEIPLSKKLFLTPVVEYSEGHLNDVRNFVGSSTNRRFSVFEFKLAVAYRFGHHKE